MEIREEIEWSSMRWYDGTSQGTRVMFVGDSITLGYSELVRERLQDTCTMAYLCTSKSIDNPSLMKELDYAMGEYPVEVLHFNNGLHGWHLSAEAYGAALEEAVGTILTRHPKTRLILATSTQSMRTGEERQEMLARNKQVKRVAALFHLPLDPLYEVGMGCEQYLVDGIHYSKEGYEKLADAAAAAVKAALPV